MAADLAGLTCYDDPVDLLSYRRDCSVVRPGRADLVVRPSSSAEVGTVLSAAARDRVPVYVRGGGTMYAGGANPHAGGIVIDLGAMNRIIELDLARGIVVVEPGIRFVELLAQLEPHGQTIGIVPVTGPAATIGGAVSAHALGTGSARHQSMADCVAGLEVVLADGTLLRTGSAACDGAGFFQRYCIGPDLTGLFLGGDASFGVVTAVCLWLYPLPAMRDTVVFGFPAAAAAATFLSSVQARELTRNVWYAAGYEGATIRARLAPARPQLDPASLPAFCVGFELGATASAIAEDRAALRALAAAVGGSEFPDFDEVYFRKLRYEEPYWYSFAGYFSRSRCAVLMTSLPCDRLDPFTRAVDELRARWPAFLWGAAVVVCRRGLHGGVIAFYDERTQWDAMLPAADDAAVRLVAAGCVPYKSGKLWAALVRDCDAYFHVLQTIKRGLDPRNILAPGNLGLGD